MMTLAPTGLVAGRLARLFLSRFESVSRGKISGWKMRPACWKSVTPFPRCCKCSIFASLCDMANKNYVVLCVTSHEMGIQYPPYYNREVVGRLEFFLENIFLYRK